MAPAACSMSHTIDENISQTASGRYESTFESSECVLDSTEEMIILTFFKKNVYLYFP